MSRHNIHVHFLDKIRKLLLIFVFLSYRKIFLGTQNEIESATVNESLVFESSSRKHAYIMLTPFNPIYIAKLGLQGYTSIFLFLLKNIDCGYSLEPPRLSAQKHRLWVLAEAVLTSTHNLIFLSRHEKYQNFCI